MVYLGSHKLCFCFCFFPSGGIWAAHDRICGVMVVVISGGGCGGGGGGGRSGS